MLADILLKEKNEKFYKSKLKEKFQNKNTLRVSLKFFFFQN